MTMSSIRIAVTLGSAALVAVSILNIESKTQTVKITGGTGKYAKARGTIKAVSIGETDNTDLTIGLT